MHLDLLRTSLVSVCCLAFNLPGLIGFRTANFGVKSTVYGGIVVGWSGVRSTDRANWHLDAKKKKTDSLGDKFKKYQPAINPNKRYKITEEALEEFNTDPVGRVELNLKTGKITVLEKLEEQRIETATGQKVPMKKGEQDQPQTAKGKKPGLMELYVKAGLGGKSVGDCPFTQYVRMILHLKGLECKVVPCAPDTKPEWLVENFEGKMPCFVHDGEAYTESQKIASYLEYFFPVPNLGDPSSDPKCKAAFEAATGLFPAVAKCIKNTDAQKDPELIESVICELKAVNNLLMKSSGEFMNGQNISLVDCSIAPKLYHTKTTLAHFKNTIIPLELEYLQKYLNTVFAHPAFVSTKYPVDVVVWGWNQARDTSA
eukprot:540581_1